MECECNSILTLNSSELDKLFGRKHSYVLLQSSDDKPFISLLSGRSLDPPNYRNQKMNFLNWTKQTRYKPHPDLKTTPRDRKPEDKQTYVANQNSKEKNKRRQVEGTAYLYV